MGLANKFLNGIGLSHLVGKIKNYVKPNPTLAGTEADLTGLEVDGTKYKVPDGGHLYEHNIQISSFTGNNDVILLVIGRIVTNSPTAFTVSTLKEYIINGDTTGAINRFSVTGNATYQTTNHFVVYGLGHGTQSGELIALTEPASAITHSTGITDENCVFTDRIKQIS